MQVLVTNDDGIDAPGIQALVASLPEGVKAVMAAPANEKSASSHSISLGQKLRVETYDDSHVARYRIHGTPADCVKFALSEIRDFKPDLILSGINQGANTGVSVYYSGTISAAREGLINRIPSVAISLCSRSFRDFVPSMEIAKKIVEGYMQQQLPPQTLINVNVPPVAMRGIKGIKITKQAASRFIEEFVPEKNHDGTQVYTLAGEIEVFDPDGTSDEEAIAQNYISVTPLKLDLTEYESFDMMNQWLENKSAEDRP